LVFTVAGEMVVLLLAAMCLFVAMVEPERERKEEE